MSGSVNSSLIGGLRGGNCGSPAASRHADPGGQQWRLVQVSNISQFGLLSSANPFSGSDFDTRKIEKSTG